MESYFDQFSCLEVKLRKQNFTQSTNLAYFDLTISNMQQIYQIVWESPVNSLLQIKSRKIISQDFRSGIWLSQSKMLSFLFWNLCFESLLCWKVIFFFSSFILHYTVAWRCHHHVSTWTWCFLGFCLVFSPNTYLIKLCPKCSTSGSHTPTCHNTFWYVVCGDFFLFRFVFWRKCSCLAMLSHSPGRLLQGHAGIGLCLSDISAASVKLWKVSDKLHYRSCQIELV